MPNPLLSGPYTMGKTEPQGHYDFLLVTWRFCATIEKVPSFGGISGTIGRVEKV